MLLSRMRRSSTGLQLARCRCFWLRCRGNFGPGGVVPGIRVFDIPLPASMTSDACRKFNDGPVGASLLLKSWGRKQRPCRPRLLDNSTAFGVMSRPTIRFTFPARHEGPQICASTLRRSTAGIHEFGLGGGCRRPWAVLRVYQGLKPGNRRQPKVRSPTCTHAKAIEVQSKVTLNYHTTSITCGGEQAFWKSCRPISSHPRGRRSQKDATKLQQRQFDQGRAETANRRLSRPGKSEITPQRPPRSSSDSGDVAGGRTRWRRG